MQNLLMVIKLLPAIIEAIKSIETAIPGQGKGEQKLAALRGILEVLDSGITAIWPQVAKIVGILVEAMNRADSMPKASQ